MCETVSNKIQSTLKGGIMYEIDLYFLKSTEWGYFFIRNCMYALIPDLEIKP